VGSGLARAALPEVEGVCKHGPGQGQAANAGHGLLCVQVCVCVCVCVCVLSVGYAHLVHGIKV
jgi:hypothetical protein